MMKHILFVLMTIFRPIFIQLFVKRKATEMFGKFIQNCWRDMEMKLKTTFYIYARHICIKYSADIGVNVLRFEWLSSKYFH